MNNTIWRFLTSLTSGAAGCLDWLLSLEDRFVGRGWATNKKPYGTGEKVQMGSQLARELTRATKKRSTEQLKRSTEQLKDLETELFQKHLKSLDSARRDTVAMKIEKSFRDTRARKTRGVPRREREARREGEPTSIASWVGQQMSSVLTSDSVAVRV